MNADPNISLPHPRSQINERAAKPPTPTSKPQPDDHNNNEKIKGAITAAAATPTLSAKVTSKHNNVISFTLNWICVVLTVAATIVFGIWAPLSYRATADGNRDNNEVQSSMMQHVMIVNAIASSALHAASAQSTALESMQSRLGAMGQLAMVDFCMTQTAVSACSYYVTNVPLTSLISYLASTTPPREVSTNQPASSARTSTPRQTAPSGSATSSSTASSAAPTDIPSSEASPNALHVPVEAVLGIVFGILTLLGLVAGLFVWRIYKRRVAVDPME